MENIFYVSPNFKSNTSNKYNSLNKCIDEINSNYELSSCIIKLYPGTYNESFTIKKPIIIEGEINNTYLYISRPLLINDELIIRNVNIFIYPILNKYYEFLFTINIKEDENKLLKELQMDQFSDNKKIDKKVILENVKFKIQNYNQPNLFLLENGKIYFKKSEIIYNCNKKNDNINNNTKLIFLSKLNTEILIEQCKFEFKIINPDLTIFNLNMSSLKIEDSIVEKKSDKFSNSEKYNIIINNYYSLIEINNSKLINSINNGKVINYIDDSEFIRKLNVENLILESNKIVIKINSNNYLELLLIINLKSIIINDKKYFFKNYIFNNNFLEIYINNLDDPYKNKNIENPQVEYLYNTSIKNSYIEEQTNIDNYEFQTKYPKNYGLIIVNTNINNFNNELCNLYLNNKSEIVGIKFNIVGEIRCSKNIISNSYEGNGENISNINFKKYTEGIKSGYRIEEKEINKGNIGENSIDLTFISREKNVKISKEKYGIMGDYSFGIGIDNIILGKNNFIGGLNNRIVSDGSFCYGNNLLVENDNVFCIGRYNLNIESKTDKLFVIGNGDEENRSDGLVFFQNGDLMIGGRFSCYQLQVDNLNIENNNINDVNNISINENLFCDGDLHLEGSLNGKEHNNEKNLSINILDNNGIKETKIQITLKNLVRTRIDGGIISFSNTNYLLNFNEELNGVLYKMIIICTEEPDFNDLRLVISENENLNNYSKEILGEPIIYNQEWKKGKYKEIELEKFNLENKYLYLCRMDNFTKYNKKDPNLEKIFTKGKFLIKFYGASLF